MDRPLSARDPSRDSHTRDARMPSWWDDFYADRSKPVNTEHVGVHNEEIKLIWEDGNVTGIDLVAEVKTSCWCTVAAITVRHAKSKD